MTELESYKLDDIVANGCLLLENSDNSTDLDNEYSYLLATHVGTMNNNPKCKYVEAIKYIEEFGENLYSKGFNMMYELYESGYIKAGMYVGEYYENNDVNKAIEIYSNCLKNPDCDKGKLCLKLGMLYDNLDPQPDDMYGKLVIEYMKEAADNYNIDIAQFYLALAYYHGMHVQKDADISYSYCLAAAENGDDDAQYWLGTSFLYNAVYQVELNFDLGVKYLKMSADQHNPSALCDLGILYFREYGDIDTAEKYFHESLEYGEAPLSYAYLGEIYYMRGDYENALKNLEYLYENHIKSKDDVMSVGLDKLADMYRYGKGCKENIKKVVEIYELINEKETLDQEKVIFIAQAYHFGKGVERDVSKAVKYYKIYANENATIMYILGSIALKRQAPELSIDDAVHYLTNAAERGIPNGYRLLADYYYDLGNRFHDRAMSYYKKAFEKGDADSAYYIGVIYENGSAPDIYKSNTEALKWYEMAAEKGSDKGAHEVSCFKKTLFGCKRIAN